MSATRLVRDGAAWVVETPSGTQRTRSVVLATNAYSDDLWPDLKRDFTKIQYFQLATAPLTDSAANILPGRQGVWDTGTIMFSLRRDAEDRLVIGGMGKVLGKAERGLSHRWARKQVGRLFPSLDDVAFEEAWHGTIATTPDHPPRICELAENLYAPIGFNGRGITTGTVFGKALSDLLAGTDHAALPLPITPLKTVPGVPIYERMYQAAFTANQVMRSI